MSRILVTGASGFVGRSLVPWLADRGHHVTAAVRVADSAISRPLVMPVIVPPFGKDDAFAGWRAAADGADVVVHLAGIAHVMGYRSLRAGPMFEAINLGGTRTVARAALAAGVQRFVYVSTAKVFGEETTDRAFHEGDAPAPMDAYARSKLMAETEVIRLASEAGTEVVIVRPPLVYGPNARGNLARIVKAVQRGLPLPVAGRDNRRSLVSIWNLCEVLERAAVRSGLSGRILLPTDDRPVSTRQLVQLLAKTMGCRARFLELPDPILAVLGRVPGIRSQLQKLNGSLELDGASTWRLLGAEPPVALEAGIRRMLTEDGVIR